MFRRFNAAYALFLFATLLCVRQATVGAAPAPSATWKAAAEAYAIQEYDSALQAYLTLEAEGFEIAGLYYNIGNCYYRLGETGPAVYYYQKALLHDPSDKKTAVNLALAEQRIRQPLNTVQPIFFIQWWNVLVTTVSPTFWAWSFFVLWIGFLILLYLKTGRLSRMPYLNHWMTLNLLLLLGSASLFYYSYQSRYHSPLAVLMDDTPLTASPGQEMSAAGIVPEGTTVSIKSASNALYEVRLPNGGSGWIEAVAVRKLEEK